MDTQHKHGAGEVGAGIEVDPAIMHGVPVIAGTRIPVRLIVGHLAGGEDFDALMRAYDLTAEQIRAALRYAAERLDEETVYVVSAR